MRLLYLVLVIQYFIAFLDFSRFSRTRPQHRIRSFPFHPASFETPLGIWFSDQFPSSLPRVPPGIRIKCVVHTRAIKARGGGQAARPLFAAFFSVAVSGPELRMISNRIARNIIRYVFHYRPTLRFGIQIRLPIRLGIPYVSLVSRYVSSSYTSVDIYINLSTYIYYTILYYIYIQYTCTFARKRTSEKLVRAVRGRGNKKKNGRNGETRPAKPEASYNTVASRIRNLLLIIMLSILTRHSYLVSLSLSLLISFACPRYRRVPFPPPICRGLPRRGNRGKYRFKMIPDRQILYRSTHSDRSGRPGTLNQPAFILSHLTLAMLFSTLGYHSFEFLFFKYDFFFFFSVLYSSVFKSGLNYWYVFINGVIFISEKCKGKLKKSMILLKV